MSTVASSATVPHAASAAAPAPGGRAIAVWLVVLYAMLLAVLAVGGITRLTGSGLSIVEWQPLLGVLPPLSERDWLEVFAKYQQTPQYREVHAGMSLAAFKRIFFWEYLHRLLARLIGLATLLPWLVFVLRRRMSRSLAWRTGALFVLGGLQGVMGWLMVKSGLVDVPAVSHYRLAAHLFLALLVGGWMVWLLCDLLPDPEASAAAAQPRLARLAWGLVGITLLTAIYGAFMAGTRAGYLYTTVLDFNGELWPSGGLALTPVWLNFFENPQTIHFVHRLLGWLTGVSIIAFAFLASKKASTRRQRNVTRALVGLVLSQIGLGLLTVGFSVAVPLAVAHQVVGFLLVTASVVVARTFATAGSPRLRAS